MTTIIPIIPIIPPPLRSELKARRIVQHGETFFVIKEPDKQEYYRFDDAQYEMLRLFDGNRDLDKLVEAFNASSQEYEFDVSAATQLYHAAREYALLERSQRERNAALVERLSAERKKKIAQGKGSVLWLRFQLVDPDAFFTRIVGRMAFLWRPVGVRLSAAFVALAAVSVVLQGGRFADDFERVYFQSHQSFWGFIAIWLVALGAIALHECGHGLTCKHFGGEVHEIGFLLLAFQPCLYCNVNDAWLFEKRSHKIYVALAGVWVEMLIGAVAALVWLVIDVGNPIGRIAFTLMTVSTASSLFVNLNPLFRYDGYYILTDLLEVPNLRQNAIAYFSWFLKTRLLRLSLADPLQPTSREKRIYLLYGGLTTVWLSLMLSVLAAVGYQAVSRAFGLIGAIAFLMLAYKLIRMITGTWPATLHAWGRELAWRSPARRAMSCAAAGVAIAVTIVWSPPASVTLDGVVQAEQVVVRAPEAGFVTWVGYDARRKPSEQGPSEQGGPGGGGGGVLLQLRSDELDMELALLQGRERALTLELARAATRSDGGARRRIGIEHDVVRDRIAALEGRRAHLTVAAPPGEWRVDGPPPEVLQGRFFAKGMPIIKLQPQRRRRLDVQLDPSDLALIHRGQHANILVPAASRGPYAGTVADIAPVARAEGPERRIQVQLDMSVPSDAGAPIVGLTGRARIIGDPMPAYRHVWRAARRILRTELWL